MVVDGQGRELCVGDYVSMHAVSPDIAPYSYRHIIQFQHFGKETLCLVFNELVCRDELKEPTLVLKMEQTW